MWIRQHKIISSVVVLFLLVIVAAAGSSSNSGKTSSPALVTTSTPAGASQPPAAPSVAPQRFAGTGAENIGTINVPTQSTLHWSCATCSGGNFIIDNSATDDGQISVNSLNQTHGVTVIDAGTYHDVSINTEGQHWSISIRAGT